MIVEASIASSSPIRVLQTVVKSKSDQFCCTGKRFSLRPLVKGKHFRMKFQIIIAPAPPVIDQRSIDLSLDNQTFLFSPGSSWIRRNKS